MNSVRIDYMNHRRERRVRTIAPHSIWYGESEYHADGKQWFLRAWDFEHEDFRDFAMKDIYSWEPVVA